MTVRLGRELRLPADVAKKLRLRKGAKLEVVPTGGGVFIIAPKRIPKDQRYFYTEEWQAREREADEDIKAGRVKEFSDVEDLIRDLRGT